MDAQSRRRGYPPLWPDDTQLRRRHHWHGLVQTLRIRNRFKSWIVFIYLCDLSVPHSKMGIKMSLKLGPGGLNMITMKSRSIGLAHVQPSISSSWWIKTWTCYEYDHHTCSEDDSCATAWRQGTAPNQQFQWISGVLERELRNKCLILSSACWPQGQVETSLSCHVKKTPVLPCFHSYKSLE